MTRFVAVFSSGPDGRDALLRALDGADVLAADGLSATWLRAGAVDAAHEGGVACVLAGTVRSRDGTPARAAELARAFAQDRLDLAPLRGSFTALLWDERRRRGLVATDELGVLAPVFRRTGGDLAVALEVRDLLPLVPASQPDARALVRWLGFGAIDADRTLFAGIERLPGGHALEFAGSSWARRRYRKLEYDGVLHAPREELERELRAAVERAAAAHLGEHGAKGVLLSGGLDSAVVAAAARPAAGRLPAYSLVFPAHPDVDERVLIEAVAGELDLAPTLLPFGGGTLLPAAEEYIREWRLPPASPTLAIQLPLLRRASGDGTTKLLDGQGGDELFGASLYLLADELRRGRLRRALALARRIPGVPQHLRGRTARRALREFGLKGALPYGVHGRRERWAPPWLNERAAAVYRDANDPWRWKRQSGPRWWSALADAVTEQRERAGAHEYLRRRNALAGVAGGHPLLQDLDLIELVLRLPPELAFDPTLDRPLLRSAMTSVPDVIRHRSEKAFFTPLFLEAVETHDAAEIRRLLTADEAAVRQWTRSDAVSALLDAPTAERGEDRAWALWRLAVAELWLRECFG